MTTTSTKYEGPSTDSSTTPPVIILPPIAGTMLGQGRGFVVTRARWNFNQPINIPVDFNSIVVASITELTVNPDTGLLDLPFIGNAHMWIRNVAPQRGVVFVTGYIDWDRDLDVRLSFIIA
jgi:hypothetical protein